jgi:hypothetical protein
MTLRSNSTDGRMSSCAGTVEHGGAPQFPEFGQLHTALVVNDMTFAGVGA